MFMSNFWQVEVRPLLGCQVLAIKALIFIKLNIFMAIKKQARKIVSRWIEVVLTWKSHIYCYINLKKTERCPIFNCFLFLLQRELLTYIYIYMLRKSKKCKITLLKNPNNMTHPHLEQGIIATIMEIIHNSLNSQ